MDNIVFRKRKDSDIELRVIDFGQSINVANPENQIEVSTYWSANRYVDYIPTIFGDQVVKCYDKVTLEMDLLIKYGIDHSFTMTKECRRNVNDDYISKHFRKLLKLNSYDTLKFESTKQREKRKGINKPPKNTSQKYDEFEPIKDAARYYEEVPADVAGY